MNRNKGRRIGRRGAIGYTAAAMIFVSVVGAFLFASNDSDSDDEDYGATPISIEATRAESIVWQSSQRGFGTVASLDKADIGSPIGGVVDYVLVDAGDAVAAGELLAMLDIENILVQRRQQEAAILAAQANVDLMRARFDDAKRSVEARLIMIDKAKEDLQMRQLEYDDINIHMNNHRRLYQADGIPLRQMNNIELRMRSAEIAVRQARRDVELRSVGFRPIDLFDRGYKDVESEEEYRAAVIDIHTATASAELMTALGEFEIAQARLEHIEIQLERAYLRSPIDGFVSFRSVYIGESLSPSEIAFTVISLRRLALDVEIEEQAARDLHVGAEAIIYWESERSNGNVSAILPLVDSRSGGVVARIMIDDPPPFVRPGMFGRVEIFSGETRSDIIVSASAVSSDHTGANFVWASRSGIATKVEVEIIEAFDGKVAILSGIRDGEILLIDGGAKISNGDAVSPILQ